jgi:RNA polymerase sigma factor (sigma-70 family)
MSLFDELYKMYTPHVYRFARALTRDAGDAEDLFQETWLRAYRAAATGTEPRQNEAKAWLFAIAANVHKDQLRKKRVRRIFLSERKRAVETGTADADPARTSKRGRTFGSVCAGRSLGSRAKSAGSSSSRTSRDSSTRRSPASWASPWRR